MLKYMEIALSFGYKFHAYLHYFSFSSTILFFIHHRRRVNKMQSNSKTDTRVNKKYREVQKKGMWLSF